MLIFIIIQCMFARVALQESSTCDISRSDLHCVVKCRESSETHVPSVNGILLGSQCANSTNLERLEFRDCLKNSPVVPVGWLNTHSVKHLRLSSCDIRALPPGLFTTHPCATHTLTLWNNPNLLLRNNSFAGLDCTLTHLEISETGLTSKTLWAVSGLIQLIKLDISSNRLTFIPGGVFSRLSRLTFLYLSRNPLVFEPNVQPKLLPFTGLETKLNTLTITFIPIKTVSRAIFGRLRALEVFEFTGTTQLECDCRLSWLKVSWLRFGLEARPNCLNTVLLCKGNQTNLHNSKKVDLNHQSLNHLPKNDVVIRSDGQFNTFNWEISSTQSSNTKLINSHRNVLETTPGIDNEPLVIVDRTLAIALTSAVLTVLTCLVVFVVVFKFVPKTNSCCTTRRNQNEAEYKDKHNCFTVNGDTAIVDPDYAILQNEQPIKHEYEKISKSN